VLARGVRAPFDQEVDERATIQTGSRALSSTAAPDRPRTGGLTGKEVQGVVRSHWSDVKGCYEHELTCHAVSGQILAHFVIGSEGTVVHVDTSAGDLTARVKVCVARVLAAWRFPSPRGGGLVSVNYPFIFKRG
jgi:hypothetical protein